MFVKDFIAVFSIIPVHHWLGFVVHDHDDWPLCANLLQADGSWRVLYLKKTPSHTGVMNCGVESQL